MCRVASQWSHGWAFRELHPRVISALGLPERSGAFMVNLDAITYPESVKAKSITTMVPTIQDIALIVSSEVVLVDLINALTQGLAPC